jgi:sugar O-acyltransferase (sialic acid O-acetyltransferase NeuD family)
MMDSILVWGCGGHGREMFFLCERSGIQIAGALDERPFMKGTVVDGVPVLGDIGDALSLRSKVKVLCAGVGDPALKKHFLEKTIQAGFEICDPIIHPNVYVSPINRVGKGSVFCDGVTLTVGIVVGDHVIVNRAATIGHDVIIGDFSTIAPGVNLSGNIIIGEGAYIGTGSSIREKLTIGEWTTIAGGAFVRADVPAHVLVAGVPAVYKKTYS